MAKLTKRIISRITQPGRYSDGDGLYLRVTPAGSKMWLQRLRVKATGKRHDLGLGPLSLVSLEQARIAATENRLMVWKGGDPMADRRKPDVPTFATVAAEVLDQKRDTWRGTGSEKQWRLNMERYVLPRIGARRVDQLDNRDVLRVLLPIWTKKPAIAKRVRQWLKLVFARAVAQGYREDNPAGEVVDGALPRVKSRVTHNRALPYQDIPEALDAVEAFSGVLSARLALRLTIVTAARNGETRMARWSEFDIEGATWSIPAERMKAEREHRVPLSAAALEVLERARLIDDGSGLVFPSPVRRGNPLSDATLINVLRQVGLHERTTVHGFRSSFRDWCAESGKDRELAESALAHTVGGTEAAYFRSDLFDRRRRLMNQWAAYLTGEHGTVVSLHG